MRLLLIDNHDSFTYNLLHLFDDLDCEIMRMPVEQVLTKTLCDFDAVLISPGPGLPHEMYELLELTRQCFDLSKPTLGVCLGLQAIGLVAGAELSQLNEVQHGVQSKITQVDSDPLLNYSQKMVGRYHSWVIKPETVPAHLIVSSVDEKNTIMSCRIKDAPIYGVQFHPESYMSLNGKQIAINFLQIVNDHLNSTSLV